jgi:uncharacterized membrane protein YphA (DoxX/SURF4 family)
MGFTDRLASPRAFSTARAIFAICIADFGIQNILCGQYKTDVPVIPWLSPHPVFIYSTGALFLACGLALLANFRPRPAALLLAAFLLLMDFIFLIPQAVRAPRDISSTVIFEALSIAAGAMLIARHASPPPITPPWLNATLASARYLFAFSMVVFGITHFRFLKFIGALIPGWIKINSTGGIAWAAFTGAFMVLTGLLIAAAPALRHVAPRIPRIAALLLGLMFALWFLLLHLPRVFTFGRRSPDEWQSAFICLSMAAICWMLAADSPSHDSA